MTVETWGLRSPRQLARYHSQVTCQSCGDVTCDVEGSSGGEGGGESPCQHGESGQDSQGGVLHLQLVAQCRHQQEGAQHFQHWEGWSY